MSTANQESLNLKPKEPYKAPFDLSKAQFPNEIQIIHGENYSSKTISKLRFKKGDVICKITQATEKPKASWISQHKHIELNSELVYLNHSCNPSIQIDVEKMQIVALSDLQVGDELTFFYPSTEFDMDQGFECWCKSLNCVKQVRGAKYLTPAQQSLFILQPHIKNMLAA